MSRIVVPKEILLKREVLICKANKLEEERRQILAQIETLDQAALIFDPEYMPIVVAKKTRPPVIRQPLGVSYAQIMATVGHGIRAAAEPVSTTELLKIAMQTHGEGCRPLALEQRVRKVLGELERTRVIESIRTDGERSILWRSSVSKAS